MPNQVFPKQVFEDISEQEASLITGGQVTVIDNILDVPPRETDPKTRRIVAGVAVIMAATATTIRVRLKSYDYQ